MHFQRERPINVRQKKTEKSAGEVLDCGARREVTNIETKTGLKIIQT